MGHYFVFEGPDGVGKSTAMSLVAQQLRSAGHWVIETAHPGSTPLGQHIRQLVKYPEKIDPQITMDDLSRQILYMVDTISFVNNILIPALEDDAIVLADRSSFISALVYGLSDGLDIGDIARFFALAQSPRPDRVFILKSDINSVTSRLGQRSVDSDHYDSKPTEFQRRVVSIYNSFGVGLTNLALLSKILPKDKHTNLPFVSDNLKFVDPLPSAQEVADVISKDILSILQV